MQRGANRWFGNQLHGWKDLACNISGRRWSLVRMVCFDRKPVEGKIWIVLWTFSQVKPMGVCFVVSSRIFFSPQGKFLLFCEAEIEGEVDDFTLCLFSTSRAIVDFIRFIIFIFSFDIRIHFFSRFACNMKFETKEIRKEKKNPISHETEKVSSEVNSSSPFRLLFHCPCISLHSSSLLLSSYIVQHPLTTPPPSFPLLWSLPLPTHHAPTAVHRELAIHRLVRAVSRWTVEGKCWRKG